jgi:hypothetical protein
VGWEGTNKGHGKMGRSHNTVGRGLSGSCSDPQKAGSSACASHRNPYPPHAYETTEFQPPTTAHHRPMHPHRSRTTL